MAELILRPYQRQAITAIERDARDGYHRLGLSLSTGLGKTVILAHLAQQRQRQRVLILVHRDELVTQTADKLRSVDPRTPVGIVKAGRNEGGAPIVIASIQTVHRVRRAAQLGHFGTIIADEAHRSMADQWVRTFAMFGAVEPAELPEFPELGEAETALMRRNRELGVPLLLGFTATWTRSDKRQLGDLWQKISFRRGTAWSIRNRHLVPPIGKAVRIDLDLDHVRKSGADYSDTALGKALTNETVAEGIVQAYRMYAADRQGVLFAPNVSSAEFFADALNRAGFRTETVFGVTPLAQRREIYARSRRGETQILASCGVLAEGFDAPWISAGVLARPTLHPGLFIQQVGRVLRLCPICHAPCHHKPDAMIIDVVGATELHKIDWWQDLIMSDPRADDDELDEGTDEIDDELLGGGFDPPDDPGWNARIVGFEDVEMFGQQRAHWMRTATGVMYVDCDPSLLFVEPIPGTDQWRVGMCSKRTLATGHYVGDEFDSLADAMDWAGDYAIENNSTTASRSAPWRQKARNRAPSSAQSDYAMSLGIDPARLNAEQVSDAITYVLASRVLMPVKYPSSVLA
jgi:superfamily II DNA or RNA helicase